MASDSDTHPFKGVKPENHYVAFVDILGFGSQIERNFETMLSVYENLVGDSQELHESLENTAAFLGMRLDVTLKVFSDAFLLTSSHLDGLIHAVKAIHMVTLFHDCLVRGGIAYGKHLEVNDSRNIYVVSQALVKAVGIEKKIRHPCVAIHDDVEIPGEWWDPACSNFQRGVLYFEGMRIVNPFNLFWGFSAMRRVRRLLDQYSQHSKKYQWFLKLYEVVGSDIPLIPPNVGIS